MKADPSAQLKLLDVQALDARADQLRHQRQTLPEIAKISELTTHHTTVLSQLRDQQIVVDDLTAAQTKADADVEQVKARRARDQQRMDLGQITNPKDLEHMQHELETLQRRITVLEDEELEVMEQLEIAATGLDVLRQEVTDAETTMAELIAERDRRAVEIDASLAEIVAQREPAVEGLPEDLLALYERLREEQERRRRGRAAGPGVHRLPAQHRLRRARPDPDDQQRHRGALRGVPADPRAHL